MASNNKEFQEYLDTFDEPSKHRDLLWDAWVEATRVAEEKFTSTNTHSTKSLCDNCLCDCILEDFCDSEGFAVSQCHRHRTM